MSLLFNTLSRFIITYLPRSKCLLISWLQSTSAMILEPKKIKSVPASTFLPFYLPWSDGTGYCKEYCIWTCNVRSMNQGKLDVVNQDMIRVNTDCLGITEVKWAGMGEFNSAAAKSLQSCPTLCDLIDGSPPGSPVPGILQARTLEWVAISFSNAWKWKVKEKSLSCVRLLATPRTAAHQVPLSIGFSRQEYWSGVPLTQMTIISTTWARIP